jgi:hypothetical protein
MPAYSTLAHCPLQLAGGRDKCYILTFAHYNWLVEGGMLHTLHLPSLIGWQKEGMLHTLHLPTVIGWQKRDMLHNMLHTLPLSTIIARWKGGYAAYSTLAHSNWLAEGGMRHILHLPTLIGCRKRGILHTLHFPTLIDLQKGICCILYNCQL